MADKAATIYIVDVGRDMGKKHSGREESDFDFAMKYVWDKITSHIMNGRKTDCVGVVGLRTDDTDNPEASDEDESYNHITVLKPLGQCTMDDLRFLKKHVKVARTNRGDGISALVVAIQRIVEFCKKLKYIKNITLITNGTGAFDDEGIEDIVGQMTDNNIGLTVLGVDFDDADFGFKEEEKDPKKADNEAVLKNFVKSVGGMFGTMAEAVIELQNPRGKTVRPVTTFKGTLTLGDPTDVTGETLVIEVERYPKIMPLKPVSASAYTPTGGEAMEEGSNLEAVRQNRVYRVNDEEIPGVKKEVAPEELDRGYMYGKEAVPISESDRGVTDFPTNPGIEISGFIPQKRVPMVGKFNKDGSPMMTDEYHRYMSMTNTGMIVGQKGNAKASMALSSLIHALYETDCYAVARFVTKQDKPPVMIILAPNIEDEFECLYEVQVPFQEDVRKYRFPPLGVVKAVSGKLLDEHRTLPSKELEEAMSDYVDSMDLMTAGKDAEGDVCEFAAPEDTYTPLYHRINQAIKHRAIHPHDPIPPPYEVLLKYSQPPPELVQKAKPHLDALVSAADLKHVPPKAKGRKGRDQPKPISGLNVDELLGKEDKAKIKTQKISVSNAVPDFLQKLQNMIDDIGEGDGTEAIGVIARDFMWVIEEIIRNSLADVNYEKAAECLKHLRRELVDFDEPQMYNEMIKGLKGKLLGGELGGDREEMWDVVVENKLGLVRKVEYGGNEYCATEEEASEFYAR